MLDGGLIRRVLSALKNVSSLKKLKSQDIWSVCLEKIELKLIAPNLGEQMLFFYFIFLFRISKKLKFD